MTRILLVGGLALAAAACTKADAQTSGGGCVTDCATMQYVGNTPDEYDGRRGLYIYYLVCQNEFGPNHRMCTQGEIWSTVDLPRIGAGALAWFGQGCDGWSSEATSETVGDLVNERGQFYPASCTAEYPVACCGPR